MKNNEVPSLFNELRTKHLFFVRQLGDKISENSSKIIEDDSVKNNNNNIGLLLWTASNSDWVEAIFNSGPLMYGFTGNHLRESLPPGHFPFGGRLLAVSYWKGTVPQSSEYQLIKYQGKILTEDWKQWNMYLVRFPLSFLINALASRIWPSIYT